MVSQMRKGRLWLFASFCPTALLLLLSTAAPEAQENLLGNPSFEEVAADQPLVWQIELRNRHKGLISIRQDRSHAGRNSLELSPNDENTGTTDCLGVGQAIAATPYRGKSLRISGWMAAEGDAKANLAVYVMTEKIEAIAHLDFKVLSAEVVEKLFGLGVPSINDRHHLEQFVERDRNGRGLHIARDHRSRPCVMQSTR